MNGEASSTGDGHETEVVAAPANCGFEGTDGDGSDEDGKAAADDVDSGDDDDSSHFTQFDVVQQTPLDHHFLDEVEQVLYRFCLGKTLAVSITVHSVVTIRDMYMLFAVPASCRHHLRSGVRGPDGPTPGGDGGRGGDAIPGRALLLRRAAAGVVPGGAAAGVLPLLRPARHAGGRTYRAPLRRECLPSRALDHAAPAPPEGLAGHFRRRGRHVLRACEAYLLQGCAVGTLDAYACATAGSRERRPCSAGLRIALAAVVPRLVEAFTEIGADGCEHFDRLRLQRAVQVMECLPRCI
ncbi:hypothetical protein HU200_035311 [Digitaria exilis]|uniref:Uncharacterized protein n=1 Tax=Digitaria exilis TaxID=1010633 RepID=A0A835BMW2_9POAL|nr:hypothetical protein HU200_035311 [Digitaria exilis]